MRSIFSFVFYGRCTRSECTINCIVYVGTLSFRFCADAVSSGDPNATIFTIVDMAVIVVTDAITTSVLTCC